MAKHPDMSAQGPVEAAAADSGGTSWWVVGGVYADTAFERISPETAEQRFGPYASYKAALDEWARLAWRYVDDAHCRFRIVRQDGLA